MYFCFPNKFGSQAFWSLDLYFLNSSICKVPISFSCFKECRNGSRNVLGLQNFTCLLIIMEDILYRLRCCIITCFWQHFYPTICFFEHTVLSFIHVLMQSFTIFFPSPRGLEVIILKVSAAKSSRACCCCFLHTMNFPLGEFSMFTLVLLLMWLCEALSNSWLLSTIKQLQMLQLCRTVCVCVCACCRAQITLRLLSALLVESNVQSPAELSIEANCETDHTRSDNEENLTFSSTYRCFFSCSLYFLPSWIFHYATLLLWLHICATSGWIRRQ